MIRGLYVRRREERKKGWMERLKVVKENFGKVVDDKCLNLRVGCGFK